MRLSAISLVMLLLLAALVPIGSSQKVQQIPISEGQCGLESYSEMVQIAFEREAQIEKDITNAESLEGDWLAVISGACKEDSNLAPYVSNILGADSFKHSIHLDGAWILSFSDDLLAKQSLGENEYVEAFYPLRSLDRDVRLIPNDPKFNDQWHLRNTGQSGNSGEDVNITDTWDNYKGTGVMISIVDDGVDTDHPDLSPNYDTTLDYDYCGNDNNPNPSSNDHHGTSSAGVAAAIGNDGTGVTGAAMDADLIGVLLLDCSLTDTREANALSHSRGFVDISSNSWGPSDSGGVIDGPGPLLMAALEDNAYLGRSGKGMTVTLAGGNGHANSDNSNYDGYANSRFTIGVAAVTDYGSRSWYSEDGANILVAAPSNGGENGITTTENGGGYTDDFGGTSSATPLVSGIIALILEANPDLTWRDVQHILANSARKNDASDSDWQVNSAGHDINHKYGFGVVDAGLAVTLAENWGNIGPEVNWSSTEVILDVTVPDDDTQFTTDTINVDQSIRVESVEILFDADHDYRGDLDIELVSPSGTESVLASKRSDSGNDYNNWVFSSVRHWDEDSLGDWTLKVRDRGDTDEGTWNSWKLMIHGSQMITDSDEDGLLDLEETPEGYGTDPDDWDTDDDGLSDGQEVLTHYTDPLSNDSDMDGLDDYDEINNHTTNPLSNDTDGDGLLDWDEIYIHFSNPLQYDEDGDGDGWYWFEDCNDSNASINPDAGESLNGFDDNCINGIDEGYELMDSDQDGLNDWEEYHIYGTNHYSADTDGDGLRDRDEIDIYFSDPLVSDPDNDTDSFHWFRDCNDSNPDINPGAFETLNAIDDDCDDLIDEGYDLLDTDDDGLSDYSEYHIHKTHWYHNDSDDDGLTDGMEVLVHLSDPMKADYDEDEDGWYNFSDCDDDDENVNPSSIEIWNKIDDDCDDLIDEGVQQPIPKIIMLSSPETGKVDSIVAFSAKSENAETINWTVGNSSFEGEYLNLTFEETGDIEWRVCAISGDLETCELGSIKISALELDIDSSNVTSENGNKSTVNDDVESIGDSLILDTGLILMLISIIIILVLIVFLQGRRGGGATPYYPQDANTAGLPGAPNLPPMDANWEGWS